MVSGRLPRSAYAPAGPAYALVSTLKAQELSMSKKDNHTWISGGAVRALVIPRYIPKEILQGFLISCLGSFGYGGHGWLMRHIQVVRGRNRGTEERF